MKYINPNIHSQRYQNDSKHTKTTFKLSTFGIILSNKLLFVIKFANFASASAAVTSVSVTFKKIRSKFKL